MRNTGQQQTDQTANFFWVLVIIILIGMVLWWLEKRFIINTLFLIRYYEIHGIMAGADSLNYLLNKLHLPLIDITPLSRWLIYVQTNSSLTVKYDDVIQLSYDVGHWMEIPVIFCLLLLAMYLFFKHPGAEFHRTYTMEELKKLENQN